MKEKMLDRFKFSDELKEKVVIMVVYQNRFPKELSQRMDCQMSIYLLIGCIFIKDHCNSFLRFLQ